MNLDFNWFAVDWENDILFWPSFYLFYWVLQWYITKNQHLKNNPACNTQFNLKNAVNAFAKITEYNGLAIMG